MSEAVDWAIKQKEEIIAMCLTEYDEESAIRGWKQDGIEMGREEKAVENALTLIHDYNASPEVAAQKMGAPLDKVLEALKEGAPA